MAETVGKIIALKKLIEVALPLDDTTRRRRGRSRFNTLKVVLNGTSCV